MANAADIFSFNGPQSYPDEAPPHSLNIGERAINTALDYADALIRAKYGPRAGIPIAGVQTTGASGFNGAYNTGGDSSAFLVLAVVVVVLILVMRR